MLMCECSEIKGICGSVLWVRMCFDAPAAARPPGTRHRADARPLCGFRRFPVSAGRVVDGPSTTIRRESRRPANEHLRGKKGSAARALTLLRLPRRTDADAGPGAAPQNTAAARPPRPPNHARRGRPALSAAGRVDNAELMLTPGRFWTAAARFARSLTRIPTASRTWPSPSGWPPPTRPMPDGRRICMHGAAACKQAL